MSIEKNAYHYKHLKVWQKAMELVSRVYQVTNQFPKSEQFGLVSQMRRSAISIPSNIAEGHGRQSDKEFIRFMDIARGSLYELDTQMEIGRLLNYFQEEDYACISSLLDETSRILFGLRKSKS